MDKNLIRLILVLIVLTALAGYYLWDKSLGETSEGGDRNFAIPNPDLVTKIVITDREGNRSELNAIDQNWLVAGIPVNPLTKQLMLRFKPKASVYRGGFWTVNNEYVARPAAIGILLETLKKIKVDQPIPEQSRQNVLDGLIQESRKVEVFMGDDQPVRVFHVGGGAPNTYGTYTVMEQDGSMSGNVYLTYILNFDGYLMERFISDPHDWRDKAVFRFLPKEIKRVAVNYFDAPEQSFEIEREEGDVFSLTNPDVPAQSPQMANSLKVQNYLQHFTNISIEAYLNHVLDPDTLNVGPAKAQIDVEDIYGKERSITLFYKPVNQRTKMQFDTTGSPNQYDIDRFYGEMNDGQDFVIAQFFVFGKVLKPYSFFLEGTTEPSDY